MSYRIYIKSPKCSCCGHQEIVDFQITGNFSGLIACLLLNDVLGPEASITNPEIEPLLTEALYKLRFGDTAKYYAMQHRYGDWGSVGQFEDLIREVLKTVKRIPGSYIENEM